jgi:hypothetical protein
MIAMVGVLAVSAGFAGPMIASDDQQVLARRGIPTRRIIVNSAVAHVHAINDGKI